MFYNYLKFAWRNLLKNKWVNLLNLFGLAAGLSIAFILMMIIRYDTSFDNWEPDYKNTYSLYSYTSQDDINSGVTAELPDAIKNQVTGVKEVTHILLAKGTVIFRTGDATGSQSFAESKDVVYVDPSYFSMFPHKWLAGQVQKSVINPGQVVLSEKTAQRFFPNRSYASIVGKSIKMGDSITMQVSGIVSASEAPSDFDYQIYVSLATVKGRPQLKADYGWGEWGHISYASLCLIRLSPGVDVASIESQLAKITTENDPPLAGMAATVPKLLPLADYHLAVNVNGTIKKSTLVNLGIVGLFILLLAIINYVNISTAQASLRIKEIAIRKSFGGTKQKIRWQMLFETLLLTTLACLLAILLVPVFMHGFAGFIPKDFRFSRVINLQAILWMLSILLFVSLAAGFYPAMILSGFNPINVLQQGSGGFHRKGASRRVLIVFQFVVAQVLVMMVLTINRQIQYSLNKDLGYKHVSGIVSFYVPTSSNGQPSSKSQLVSRLKEEAGVNEVSLSSAAPTSSSQSITTLSAIGKDVASNFQVWSLAGDTSYLHIFGIPLVAGSNLKTRDKASSVPGEVLINETLSGQLGFQHPEASINKMINYNGRDVLVKGVMGDFNTGSTKSLIHPLVYALDLDNSSLISFSMDGGPDVWQHTISRVKKSFLDLYPDHDFSYHFLDKSIEQLYKKDIAISRLLSWSSGLGILISCMGLFGLISFVAGQRRKEIGVRKVLGASITEIIRMLNSKMLWLVLIAVLIAIPLGWGLSELWLRKYAYRTSISVAQIIASAGGLFLLALIVLTLKSFFAARTNPIDSIRAE